MVVILVRAVHWVSNPLTHFVPLFAHTALLYDWHKGLFPKHCKQFKKWKKCKSLWGGATSISNFLFFEWPFVWKICLPQNLSSNINNDDIWTQCWEEMYVHQSSEMGMQEVLIMKMTRSDGANIYRCGDDLGLFALTLCDAGFRRPYIWGRGRAPNFGPRTRIFFHILIFYRDYCTIALKSTNPPYEKDSDSHQIGLRAIMRMQS